MRCLLAHLGQLPSSQLEAPNSASIWNSDKQKSAPRASSSVLYKSHFVQRVQADPAKTIANVGKLVDINQTRFSLTRIPNMLTEMSISLCTYPFSTDKAHSIALRNEFQPNAIRHQEKSETDHIDRRPCYTHPALRNSVHIRDIVS